MDKLLEQCIKSNNTIHDLTKLHEIDYIIEVVSCIHDIKYINIGYQCLDFIENKITLRLYISTEIVLFIKWELNNGIVSFTICNNELRHKQSFSYEFIEFFKNNFTQQLQSFLAL